MEVCDQHPLPLPQLNRGHILHLDPWHKGLCQVARHPLCHRRHHCCCPCRRHRCRLCCKPSSLRRPDVINACCHGGGSRVFDLCHLSSIVAKLEPVSLSMTGLKVSSASTLAFWTFDLDSSLPLHNVVVGSTGCQHISHNVSLIAPPDYGAVVPINTGNVVLEARRRHRYGGKISQ